MPGQELPIYGDDAGRWLKLDCRHYRGDRPCARGVQGICPSGCSEYAPLGHRILIIKLGALGDVIRTLALLPGLKKAWPQSQITWVTRDCGVRMLSNHPLIDRLMRFDGPTIAQLELERFDLCLSLDKEPAPAALAMRIDARDRRGIGLSPHGTVYPLNRACTHYFRLGLDDTLKFQENQKSYPQLIYEALGLRYAGERYTLHPGPEDVQRAEALWRGLGVQPGKTVVGLNTGAGRVFANKTWPPQKFAALARRLTTQSDCRVALLGGPDEAETNHRLARENPALLDTGTDHDEPAFAALVARCSVLVTGDTMAMHVANALDVPAVVLFGPTCAQEIDLFGRGSKLVTGLDCAPCYRRSCDKRPNCMDDISVAAVLSAVRQWIGRSAPAQHRLLNVLETVP